MPMHRGPENSICRLPLPLPLQPRSRGCAASPDSSAFYVEIVAANVPRPVHDALDTDRAVVFTVEN